MNILLLFLFLINLYLKLDLFLVKKKNKINLFFFIDKKKVVSSSKYKCPSPPSKSPPVSRLGFKKAIFSYDIPQPSFQTPNNKGINKKDIIKKYFCKVHSKFETEFYNHQKIGEGSSSIVYKVQSVQDHKFYAVKKRKKSYNGNSLLYLYNLKNIFN